MTVTALLFPGQGSQTPEMREPVARLEPGLLELALAEVGEDPFERVEEGTRFAQPALYCASLARWAEAGRPDAEMMAGHSLGELAALAAAGVLSAEGGLRLAVVRGRLMDEAGGGESAGGMLAALGDADAARALAERCDLTVANDNAPGQLVLSGPAAGIEAAAAGAKGAGLRVRRLPVAAPFHSPAMEPAVAPFREALETVQLGSPGASVFSCAAAAPFDDVREQLAEALVRPVRWRETLVAMREAGAERFLEAGPGKVLTGLVRRTLDGVESGVLET
jgi:malonyl CoA-acyl carrier protein transacylase